MRPLPMPSHLLQLNAMFSRAGTRRVEPHFSDSRMPDDTTVLAMQEAASSQLGRLVAEVALQEGSRRQYAPRRDAEVLDAGRDGRSNFF